MASEVMAVNDIMTVASDNVRRILYIVFQVKGVASLTVPPSDKGISISAQRY